MNIFNFNEEPTLPTGRILREFEFSSKRCPVCQSSLQRKFLVFRTDKCINRDCINYYDSKPIGISDQVELILRKKLTKEEFMLFESALERLLNHYRKQQDSTKFIEMVKSFREQADNLAEEVKETKLEKIAQCKF